HDGVEIEFFEQFLFDAGADAISEEDAVRYDHATSATLRAANGTAEFSHNKLQEQERGFGGLFVFRKIRENPPLLLTAEGRIGHDDIHAIFVADLAQRKTKRVFGVNVRILETVQEQVHLAEQIR